jgi:FkbM family methyltransferase
VDFTIYCIGLYEHYLARYFARALRSDSVFLDVGAYIGQYSLLAAYYAPRGMIIAFEPVPDSARRLRVAIAENNVLNCEVIESAVGDHCGTAQMHLSKDLSSSSISETHTESHHSITVPILTIDAVVAERGLTKVDVIKMDVESCEDAAILGAKETLARFLPLVLLEVGRDTNIHQPTPALALLAALGYRFFRMNHSKLDLVDGRIEAAENVIAIPPGRSQGSR